MNIKDLQTLRAAARVLKLAAENPSHDPINRAIYAEHAAALHDLIANLEARHA